MSLTGKWINLIFKVATGNWKVKLIVAPIVGVSYLLLIIVFYLMSYAVDNWLNLPKVSIYPLSTVIGVLLIIFGFSIFFLSIAHFLEVGGTPVPFCPPPELVTTGPYSFSRNPMLTGIFIQLFGIAIILGSLSLAFFFTPLFILINVWELKRIEEPELEKRLGEEYIKYKKKVPMFFPFFKRK